MEFFAMIFNKDETQLFQEILYRRFLEFEKRIVVFTFLSMFLAILEENFFFQENREVILLDDQTLLVVYHEHDSLTWVDLLRIANTVITVLLGYWVYKRKFMHYQFLKACSLVELEHSFLKSMLFIEVIIEIMAIFVQSYPSVDGYYRSQTLSRVSYYYYDTTLTAIFLILRTLFLLRSMLYCSIFLSAKSFKICFNEGAKSGLLFAIRSEFHHSKVRFVIIFVSLYVGILGFLNRLCERSFEQLTSYDWDYVWNSFWIVIVDLTTVGYGDYVPVTSFGRIIIGFVAISGGAITSLVYIIFLQTTSFDSKEEKAFDRIKVHESRTLLRNKAKKCVGLSLKFNRRRIKYGKALNSDEYLQDYEDFLVDIKNYVKDFSNLRKTIIDVTYKRKISEVILFLKDKLNIDFDIVIENLSIVDLVSQKVAILFENLDMLAECASNFEDLYSQCIVSLQYLNQRVFDLFSGYTDTNGGLLADFEGKESSFLLVDFINSAQNTLNKLRDSINIDKSGKEQPKPSDSLKTPGFDPSILRKLRKNRLITLKKAPKIGHTSFSRLESHKYSKTFRNDKSTPNPVQPLVLSNETKARNMMEFSQVNQRKNSRMENQRMSLAYRINVVSESKLSLNESRNSVASEPGQNPKERKTTVKRFEKRELTCLKEEGRNSLKEENFSDTENEDSKKLDSVENNKENSEKEAKKEENLRKEGEASPFREGGTNNVLNSGNFLLMNGKNNVALP